MGILLLLVGLEALYPVGVTGFSDALGQLTQRLLAVTQDSHVDSHILVDFRRVDVQVDDFCLTGIGLQVARHPVIKAHADGDEHITLVGLHIRSEVAVHAQHAFV